MATKQAPNRKNTTQKQREANARTNALTNKTGRTGSKARTIAELDARRREIFKLHNQGVTLPALAEKYGLDVSTVHADYRKAYETSGVRESHEQEYERMLAKLEQMEQDLLFRAQAEGRVGDEKSELARLRILERRAKLLGLDAPVRLAGHDGGRLEPIVGVDVRELARIVLGDGESSGG